jgi:hypothetical protein
MLLPLPPEPDNLPSIETKFQNRRGTGSWWQKSGTLSRVWFRSLSLLLIASKAVFAVNGCRK